MGEKNVFGGSARGKWPEKIFLGVARAGNERNEMFFGVAHVGGRAFCWSGAESATVKRNVTGKIPLRGGRHEYKQKF